MRAGWGSCEFCEVFHGGVLWCGFWEGGGVGGGERGEVDGGGRVREAWVVRRGMGGEKTGEGIHELPLAATFGVECVLLTNTERGLGHPRISSPSSPRT